MASSASSGGARTSVEIDGRHLTLSNLDKVLYPAAAFTKAQVLDYVVQVAPVYLAHLRNRPVTRVRFPDGVDAGRFFEKNCPAWAPDWIRTVEIDTPGGRTGRVRFVVIDDLATLVWTTNLAALELHTPLAVADAIDVPCGVIFDLDPGSPAGVLDCAELALTLRSLFAQLGLDCIVKTSGSKGLHVGVPVNQPDLTYDATAAFAAGIGRALEARFPDKVTTVMRRDVRPGRVFIDWSQNNRAKTTVCAYSLRGRSEPTVSTPVTWDEVAAAVDAQDPALLTFDAPAVIARVASMPTDPWAPWEQLVQTLPSLAAPGAGGGGT